MTKETKMAAPDRAGQDALLRAFEAFKAANDERLSALESGRADVVLEEKVDRINRALSEQKAAMDRLALAARRPALAGEAPALSEHKAAWNAYLRKGEDGGLSRLEAKAMSVGADADGGYVAPPELDRMIDARLREVSPMRAIASVRTTGSTVFKKPISITAAGTGWVAETGARAQTSTPTLNMLEFPTAELYANLAATQTLLDDAFVNIEEWIAGEVEQAFSGQERAAFVNGDGSNKPKGFLAYDKAANSAQAWGNLGYLATGAAGAFPAANAVERLIDLVYAPKAEYRQNARFVMNRKTLAAVRKLKDANDSYIWQPADANSAATVLGYGVTELEDMPDIATDAFSIAFGDFARGYLIVDRAGVRVLRDPYTAKPYVQFYTTARVGGDAVHFEAIKFLKFGTA